MGKKTKRKCNGRAAVSRADVESAFMTRFAALGMGLGTDPDGIAAAKAVCRSRAAGCTEVLDYLVAKR